MTGKTFQQFGSSTVALSGSGIFRGLEKGTIDAAVYAGPAENHDIGCHQVTKCIPCGPPGRMSLGQPVKLVDLTIDIGAWRRLSKNMQNFVEEQVQACSLRHFVDIQSANVTAMEKFKAAGNPSSSSPSTACSGCPA